MSYDLALKADHVTLELIDRLKERVASSPTLSSSEPTFHEMSAPPFGDLDDLEDAFDDGEAPRAAFRIFCEEQNLDPESDEAAGAFLQRLYGIDVLVVHLGSDPVTVRSAFAELRGLASHFGLVLHDPQAGSDIAETYAATMPPGF